MSQPQNEEFRSLVNRIENIHEIRDETSRDLSAIYAEVKNSGYDVKVMKALIAERRKDVNERNEHETMLDLYRDMLSRAGA